jgi:hypothetical protein
MLTDKQDAFGREIYDYFQGGGGYEIIERNDGYIDISGGPRQYFLEYEEWPPSEREAMKFATGKVLDRRHALYLQGQGLAVTGIDNSPLAIKVCQERGLRDCHVLPVTQVSPKIGTFDTIMMMGNNFGLVENPTRARWLLQKFHRMTGAAGRIIAQTRDPYQTDNPDHLAYHQRNLERGRMAGQVRIRVRYRKYVSPWFDYLMVSRDEMQELLSGTRWELREWIEDAIGFSVAIIKKR